MQNKWIKRIALIIAGLVALHLVAIAVLLGTGRSRFSHASVTSVFPSSFSGKAGSFLSGLFADLPLTAVEG